MKNSALLISAILLVCSCRAESRSTDVDKNKLPIGEMGNGESVAAFYDLCVKSNVGDGPALFSRVRNSEYEIRFEYVDRYRSYTGEASSFTTERDNACAIHVSLQDWGPKVFTCQFVISGYCKLKSEADWGPFINSEFEKIPTVSFDPQSSEEENNALNDGRYYVFSVNEPDSSIQRITLTYGGNVGSSIYFSTDIEPNHDFTGVMPVEEAREQIAKKILEQLAKEQSNESE